MFTADQQVYVKADVIRERAGLVEVRIDGQLVRVRPDTVEPREVEAKAVAGPPQNKAVAGPRAIKSRR